VIVVKPK